MEAIESFYKSHEGVVQLIVVFIALVTVYIAIIQPIVNFTRAQNIANRDKRFEIYHKLIDIFAGAGGAAMLDRQIAIAFELRRFRDYYPVTIRILTDWKRVHQNSPAPMTRLMEEMDLTIKFINSRTRRKGLLKILNCFNS